MKTPTLPFSRPAVVWDNHGCMPLRPNDASFLPELQRYRAGGVTTVTLNVGFDAVDWHLTFEMLAAFRRWIGARPEDYVLVESAADVELARDSGRLGVLFDIEGGNALNGKLAHVQAYYDLGVRWMLIAYNRNNLLGGGCMDEDTGLTDFGRSVLEEMARVGMVACCSHTGLRTTMEVMERSSKPVIFSHSNPLGVWRHRRNITDDAIRACARTGGVVGINGIGIFLGRNDASTDTLLRHIDYVVNLVGPQHVGLGLDFVFDSQELADYVAAHPEIFPAQEGYASISCMVEPERVPLIIEALLKRGYSEEAVAGIVGGNHLRVARAVWQPSTRDRMSGAAAH